MSIPLLTPIDRSLEYLGGLEVGAAAVTTGVLTIPAREFLIVNVLIPGLSGADIPALRFNGDAGANYSSRYLSSVAGGVTLVNNQNVSQTLARLFATTASVARTGYAKIINITTQPKVGAVDAQTGVASAATGLPWENGGFQWQNTTAQITSIEMRTAGGSVTLNAGCAFHVFGRDFP